MYERFEKLTQAFPPHEPQQPPKTLFAFCRYYTRGFGWPLLAMSVLSALIAIVEVSLFGFMGQLVDWLSTHNPDTFWAEEGGKMIGMGLIVLVVVPVLITLHSLVIHQPYWVTTRCRSAGWHTVTCYVKASLFIKMNLPAVLPPK